MTDTASRTDDVLEGRLVTRYLIREVISLLAVAAILFGSAGRLDWWGAWAMLAVTAGWIAGMTIVIRRRNPGLFAERQGLQKGAKGWDVVFTTAHSLLQLATFILAGLDKRYGWTQDMPVLVALIALVMAILGYALFLWAIAFNPFFSKIVRIQTERGHAVVTNGPYRFVRHPGYLGGVFSQLGIPLLLGSWPAFVAGAIDTLFLLLRTRLEDRTLHVELPGYADYAQRVRYRLVPGIW